jgi:hypothetical protein
MNKIFVKRKENSLFYEANIYEGLPMKPVALAAIATVLLATPAHAEDKGDPNAEITIGGETPAAVKHRSCVEVEIGGDKAFGCLNQRLKQQVDRVNPVLNAPPIDAKSQDLKVGVVNVPAIRQQYGRNFGVSVIPSRQPLIYNSPLGARR